MGTKRQGHQPHRRCNHAHIDSAQGESTVFKAHVGTVRCVKFSHDGSFLVTSSDDKNIKIFNTYRQKFRMSLKGGRLVLDWGTVTFLTILGHVNWVRTVAPSPDDRLLVSGSDDKTVNQNLFTIAHV